MIRQACTVLFLLSVSACGGGGGSAPAPAPQSPDPPEQQAETFGDPTDAVGTWIGLLERGGEEQVALCQIRDDDLATLDCLVFAEVSRIVELIRVEFDELGQAGSGMQYTDIGASPIAPVNVEGTTANADAVIYLGAAATFTATVLLDPSVIDPEHFGTFLVANVSGIDTSFSLEQNGEFFAQGIDCIATGESQPIDVDRRQMTFSVTGCGVPDGDYEGFAIYGQNLVSPTQGNAMLVFTGVQGERWVAGIAFKL